MTSFDQPLAVMGQLMTCPQNILTTVKFRPSIRGYIYQFNVCYHHKRTGWVSFRGGGGAEVSCPNINFVSIACTKIKWFCPNITWFICPKMAFWRKKSRGGGGLPPPPLSPMGRTPMVIMQGRIQDFKIEGAQKMRSAQYHEREARNLFNLAGIHRARLTRSSKILDALSCSLRLILKHSDTKLKKKKTNIVDQKNVEGGGGPLTLHSGSATGYFMQAMWGSKDEMHTIRNMLIIDRSEDQNLHEIIFKHHGNRLCSNLIKN